MKEKLIKLKSKLPVSFKMYAQTIRTKIVPDLYYKDNCFGRADMRKNEIMLQPNCPEFPIETVRIEHTYWHEFIHFLLYHGGSDGFNPELKDLEYLVDRLAGLLHQAITTMEFGDE